MHLPFPAQQQGPSSLTLERKRLSEFSSRNNTSAMRYPGERRNLGTRCLREFLERAGITRKGLTDRPRAREDTAKRREGGSGKGKRERSRVARWWVYGGGRGWGDRGKEDESPACIRYLSRRCCVQVNKLTRRRASAIFFPINLNLLLILFSYPTYPESPTAGSPPALAFPLPPLARTIPLPLCRRDLPLSFPPRLFVSTIDV